MYNKGQYDRVSGWVRSLDSDTYVNVVEDRVSGKRNLDDLCNTGCPYRFDCTNMVLWQMIKRAPITTTSVVINAVFIRQTLEAFSIRTAEDKIQRKYGIHAGKKLLLQEILDAYKEYESKLF